MGRFMLGLGLAGWVAGPAAAQDTAMGGRSAWVETSDVEPLVSPPGEGIFVVVLPEGTVYRIPAGTANELESLAGDRLLAGDQLRTGRRGQAGMLGSRLAAGIAGQSRVEVAGADLILRGGRVYAKTIGSVTGPHWIEALGARVRASGTEFLLETEPESSVVRAFVAAGRLEIPGPGEVPLVVGPGQVGVLGAGTAPSVGPASGSFESRMGWKLHYPAVLNLEDLREVSGGHALGQEPGLAPSLAAYQAGDVRTAAHRYPDERPPASQAEALYRASLLLATGQVLEAEALLGAVTGTEADVRLARALERMIQGIRRETVAPGPAPQTATEWLAESYVRQFAGQRRAALRAARRSVELAPAFGPALARQASLELQAGKAPLGRSALAEAERVAPRHGLAMAVRGFRQAADGQTVEAGTSFVESLRLDPRSGEGWVGLAGLFFCEGKVALALRCMQMAVLQEPQRAEFRTQLARLYRAASRDAAALEALEMARPDARTRAKEESARARTLDPGGEIRSLGFPSVCAPAEMKWYGGLAAGPAFVQDVELAFSSGLRLPNPCEPERPLRFVNGLADTVAFDPGVRVDAGLGYRLSRVLALEVQPGLVYASAPSAWVVTEMLDAGANFAYRISRGDVELIQVPLLVGAVARWPLRERLTAYAGADVGAVFSWLRLGQFSVDCYNDEEYGTAGSGEDSGVDWAFAYQAKAGLEYALRRNLILGLGYQFLGTTELEWAVFGDRLKAEALYTHSVSLRLDLRF